MSVNEGQNISWQQLMDEAHQSYLDGRNDQAQWLCKRAVHLAEQTDVFIQPRISKLFQFLADLCFAEHSHDEAEMFYRGALAVHDLCQESKNVDKAILQKQISEICRAQGREKEAIEFANSAHKTLRLERRQLERLYKKNAAAFDR
jgi:hypothetical protein